MCDGVSCRMGATTWHIRPRFIDFHRNLLTTRHLAANPPGARRLSTLVTTWHLRPRLPLEHSDCLRCGNNVAPPAAPTPGALGLSTFGNNVAPPAATTPGALGLSTFGNNVAPLAAPPVRTCVLMTDNTVASSFPASLENVAAFCRPALCEQCCLSPCPTSVCS